MILRTNVNIIKNLLDYSLICITLSIFHKLISVSINYIKCLVKMRTAIPSVWWCHLDKMTFLVAFNNIWTQCLIEWTMVWAGLTRLLEIWIILCKMVLKICLKVVNIIVLQALQQCYLTECAKLAEKLEAMITKNRNISVK